MRKKNLQQRLISSFVTSRFGVLVVGAHFLGKMMEVRKALLFMTACILLSCSNAVASTQASTTPQSNNQLVYINGDLVRLINNCTVGDTSSCPYGYCCTKKFMIYYAGFIGSKPVYQLECKPLRATGEFCYFDTPEQYCPCATRCHTNGFYGNCL